MIYQNSVFNGKKLEKTLFTQHRLELNLETMRKYSTVRNFFTAPSTIKKFSARIMTLRKARQINSLSAPFTVMKVLKSIINIITSSYETLIFQSVIYINTE